MLMVSVHGIRPLVEIITRPSPYTFGPRPARIIPADENHPKNLLMAWILRFFRRNIDLIFVYAVQLYIKHMGLWSASRESGLIGTRLGRGRNHGIMPFEKGILRLEGCTGCGAQRWLRGRVFLSSVTTTRWREL